jgi:hypothetical protein
VNHRRTWAALLFAGGAAIWSAARAGQSLTLGSGKSIEILTVGPLQSAHGWSALVLKYRTAIPLNDSLALRKEADEIWDRYLAGAVTSGPQFAIISASQADNRPAATGNSYDVIFEKQDGSWRTHETKERAQARLDAAFVRQFMERIDYAFEYNEMNALLLYMANDWTVTIANPNGAGSAPETLDRQKFVKVSHAAFAAASARRHRREIGKISIGGGGTVAEVESREIEEIAVDGRQISSVERSTDTFELRGDVMVWVKSTSVVDKRTETRSN